MLLDILLRMEHDFFIDRKRQLTQITVSKMQKTDIDRHDRGSKIPCSDIQVCYAISASFQAYWLIAYLAPILWTDKYKVATQ